MRDFHEDSFLPHMANTDGVSISAGGAHGVAFLGRLMALNQAGHLNHVRAFGGASAGGVIAAVVGSVANQGILDDGHEQNIQIHIQSGIVECFELFKAAARNATMFNASNGKFLAPFFQMQAKLTGQPDALNTWFLQNLPDLLNQDAVAEGPIDVYLGLSRHGEAAKTGSYVVKNDVRAEVVAASCALYAPIDIDGVLYEDGGFTKAAPASALIKDSGCRRLIIIGESHINGEPQRALHQTQAMIVHKSEHAVSHLEGHALMLQKQYPRHDILYSGIPLLDCDKSRGNIGLSQFNTLFMHGHKSGEAWIADHRQALDRAGISHDDRVPAVV